MKAMNDKSMKYISTMMVAFALACGAVAFANYAEPQESVAWERDARIEFRDCPKCMKRIRIDLPSGKAYVNLSRLEGEMSREEAAARAAKLLDAAKIPAASDPKIRPLMGWSSWNTFAVKISEEIIAETARAMATNGLKDAGYTYVNIDDGFFYGHGEDGKLRIHPERFPNGMKPIADTIHSLGLKAGIYSDAGADTCGSRYNDDEAGIGAGLYGHDAADCDYFFRECGFDFIKVDYCGGKWLKLDEKERYTEISEAIRKAGEGKVRFNICRWDFPGTWVADIAESWRTTRDIRANWKIVCGIIKENLYLSAYASPGHYNDMDMLEVGHRIGKTKTDFAKHGDTGLTEEEERTHFGMWCMLSSPLLIGCDVRAIPPETMKLITNPYLLAMNQNDLGLGGYVAARDGETAILVKDAGEKFGTSRYVALYNPTDTAHEFTISAAALDLGGKIDAFDLMEMADVGCFEGCVTVSVPPHGAKFYRFDAEKRLQRRVYEAECAFLNDYQELRTPEKFGTPALKEDANASNGVIVKGLGGKPSNWLEWRDVKIDEPGEYSFVFDCSSPDERCFTISINGVDAAAVTVPATDGEIKPFSAKIRLEKGVHTIRLYNPTAAMPCMDKLRVGEVCSLQFAVGS